MQNNRPSILTSLLLSASHCVRRFCLRRPVDLHGARADIVGLRTTPDDDSMGRPDSRFVIDALIWPAAADAAWRPGALTLLPSVAAPELVSRDGEGVDLCFVLGAEVLEDGRFRPAANRVCTGVRRVRLNVRVRPGLAQLCFRHGSALFGCVVLPDAAALLAI